MIDDDDVDTWAIFGSDSGGGCAGAVFFVIVLIVLAFFAAQNKEECAQRHCPDGMRPKVTSHECLCVTPAR